MLGNRITVGAAVTGLAVLAVACERFDDFQPNVPQGGRAVSIAVNPEQPQHMIVASETGGLFTTEDGGSSWKFVDGLPNYLVTDVAFAPSDPSVVIATTRVDYRADKNGPIWRSNDGGKSWEMPSGSTPAAGPRCPELVGGYDVAFEQGSGYVYVATDCGIAISADLGQSWDHQEQDPSVPPTGARMQSRVWSVLAVPGNTLIAADNGIYRSDDKGVTWTPSVGDPVGAQQWANHALAACPHDHDHLFAVGPVNKLYESDNGGSSWRVIHSFSERNRPPFVRVALASDQQLVKLYYGDGVNLWRATVHHDVAVPTSGITLVQLTVDHADPADVGFDGAGMPVLLATDGGVHITNDGGFTWQLIGGGAGGFHALQIYDVTGQWVQRNQHYVYFGTQDNSICGSANGGHTWNLWCKDGEGNWLQTPRYSDEGMLYLTGYFCCGGDMFRTLPDMTQYAQWPDAPGEFPSAPALIGLGTTYLGGSTMYLQGTKDPSSSPPVWSWYYTPNAGATWHSAFSLSEDYRGMPIIVGQPVGNELSPVAYLAVRRAGLTTDGHERIGLVRIEKLKEAALGTEPAVVSDADGWGFGSLGVIGHQHVWQPVFGVDRHQSRFNRLIAPDIETNHMKMSADGGAVWQIHWDLTRLVTDDGKFRFHDGSRTLVRAIDFDPLNPCHVLLGTAQNGVFRSTDGGITWKKVDGSSKITDFTSFYFPAEGPVLASSYGRGLWRLDYVNRMEGEGCIPQWPLPGVKDPHWPLSGDGASTMVMASNDGDHLRVGLRTDGAANAARQVRIPPYVQVTGEYNLGGLAAIPPGGMVRVFGRGFTPTSKEEGRISVTVGDGLILRETRADSAGTFTLDLTVDLMPGRYALLVEQADGQGVNRDRSTVLVMTQDAGSLPGRGGSQ